MLKQFRQSGTHYVVLGNLFAAGFGMLSFIILTRVLTKEHFGDFTSFMAAVVLFEMIRVGLFNSALIKFISSNENKTNRDELVGSGWIISIISNIFLTIIVIGSYLIFKTEIDRINFSYFFVYYPVLMWISTPVNIARSYTQATENFKMFAFLNFFVPFALFLTYLIGLYYTIDLIFVIQVNIITRLLLSIIVMITNNSRIKTIRHMNTTKIKDILNFGKFSIMSTLGSNILNSSDRLLINFFLGPQFVALWAVPLKLAEIVDNPLRSFSSTSFPKMSKLYSEHKGAELAYLLHISIGRFLFLTVPFAIFCVVFAKQIITVLAGPTYYESIIILQIISVFFILIPFSRYLGVTLTSINKPKLDSNKVLVMAIVNIIGDIVVLIVFKELWPVALVTIANVMFGILVGIYYVKKYIPEFSIRKIFTIGVFYTFKMVMNKIKTKIYAKQQ